MATSGGFRLAFLSGMPENMSGIGGADIHSKNLLEHLSSFKEIDIHVFTISKKRPSGVTRKGGVTYHTLQSPSISKTITGLTTDQWKLVRAVRALEPDIVHAHVLGAPYGIAASKLTHHFPTVVTAHTLDMIDRQSRARSLKARFHDDIWQRLEAKQIATIPHFITVSRDVERELRKRGGRDVHVIPNGIDETWFGVPSSEVMGRLTFVGRLAPIKGLDFLLEAFDIVAGKNVSASLHIVGPYHYGKYVDEIKAKVKRNGMAEKVKLTGPKFGTDLAKEYASCSVFVLPSRRESNPIALLEAMACGKPVVATRVGGIPEMLDDGVEGFLVEYGDVEQMADRMLTLLEDDDLRKRMGEAGRRRARGQTWDRVAERTVEVYRKVMEDFG